HLLDIAELLVALGIHDVAAHEFTGFFEGAQVFALIVPVLMNRGRLGVAGFGRGIAGGINRPRLFVLGPGLGTDGSAVVSGRGRGRIEEGRRRESGDKTGKIDKRLFHNCFPVAISFESYAQPFRLLARNVPWRGWVEYRRLYEENGRFGFRPGLTPNATR